MAEHPNITNTPPTGLDPDSLTMLEAKHYEAFSSMVAEELARYPTDIQPDLPMLLLVDTAHIAGVAVRARYFDRLHLGVLTPQLDTRGNVHRIVASSLLAKFADASSHLAARWVDDPSDRLYGGCLDERAEIGAVIAGVMMRRPTLLSSTLDHGGVRHKVTLAEEFLDAVGISRRHRAELDTAIFGYLTAIAGRFPSYAISPGDVSLELTPPPGETTGNYRFKRVDPSRAAEITAGIREDLWVLPESLLAEVTNGIFVVSDVTHHEYDIAGLAFGADGQQSQVVVEDTHRREILYHELGHAIHRRFAAEFPEERWNLLVPPDAYFGDPRDFIKVGVSLPDFHPSLIERGFITSYASSAMREDVAELIGALLDGDRRLWASLADANLVAQKVDLLIEFLHAANPVFTRRYLELLATARPAQEAAWSLS